VTLLSAKRYCEGAGGGGTAGCTRWGLGTAGGVGGIGGGKWVALFFACVPSGGGIMLTTGIVGVPGTGATIGGGGFGSGSGGKFKKSMGSEGTPGNSKVGGGTGIFLELFTGDGGFGFST
jgi:hypothetical protein